MLVRWSSIQIRSPQGTGLRQQPQCCFCKTVQISRGLWGVLWRGLFCSYGAASCRGQKQRMAEGRRGWGEPHYTAGFRAMCMPAAFRHRQCRGERKQGFGASVTLTCSPLPPSSSLSFPPSLPHTLPFLHAMRSDLPQPKDKVQSDQGRENQWVLNPHVHPYITLYTCVCQAVTHTHTEHGSTSAKHLL